MPFLCVETTNDKVQQSFVQYASIGRSSRCTVCIKDIKLSRVHCEIVQHDNDYILVDLNSQNGTNLNGKRVLECILVDGDTLTIGKSKVTFLLTEGKSSLPKFTPLPTKKIGTKDLSE